MHQHDSGTYPPPDVLLHASSAAPPARPLPRGSDFLIVGLFALRLTKTLIEGLPQYAERYGDLAWLAHMLAPFPSDYDLAKLTGERRQDYLRTYPAVVSRMKRQPGYPLRFMQLNPATVARLDVLHRQGGMTDGAYGVIESGARLMVVL